MVDFFERRPYIARMAKRKDPRGRKPGGPLAPVDRTADKPVSTKLPPRLLEELARIKAEADERVPGLRCTDSGALRMLVEESARRRAEREQAS